MQNSQCSVNLAGSWASGSVNNLTLNLALTFKTGFLGTQNAYLSAGDSSGQNSTWQQMGSWTVPGPTAPSGTSISIPYPGSGNSGTFTATFTDPAGSADIEYMQIWFSANGTNSANSCMLLLGHSTGLFQVLNDAGTAWQGSIPTGQSDHNSQCTLNTANSGFTYNGITATMTVNVTFSAGFAGTKGVWLWADNFANEYAWSGQVGSWTVTGAGPPAGMSITPNSGSGSAQTFRANFADPVSAANIQYLEMTITGNNSTAANNCSVLYSHSTQQFALSDDSGGWRTGFAPGGSDSNSQCTLTTSSPGASFSGTAASMTFTATFKPAFVGAKQLYLWTENYAGQSAGSGPWGSWTVTSSGGPIITSLSPTSGSVNTLVTIGGSGFGSTQGSSSVTFNGIVATHTTWSQTVIQVLVPPGQTTGNVVVTVNGYQAIAPQQFTVNSTITTGPNFPTDFQDCINQSGTPTNPLTCELLPGIYTLNGAYSPLTIGGSNLIITGGGGPGDTTLRRGNSTLESIMTVVATVTTVTNVTISNLTFDGNRYGFGTAPPSGASTPPNLSCLPGNSGYWDLDLSLPATGPGSGPTGAFTLEWLDFINAPATALLLGGAGSTVSVSNVGQGTVAPGGAGYGPGGVYGAETAAQTATRSAGISITDGTGAWYNNISYAGTAGLALGGLSGAPQYAYGNKLTQNRYELSDWTLPGMGTCPASTVGGCLNQGGQLLTGGTNVSVAANVIIGNLWPTPANPALGLGPPYTTPATNCPWGNGTAVNAGIEAYGSQLQFYNNEINTNTGSGMSLAGGNPTSDVTLSSANPWDSTEPPRAIEGNSHGGIVFVGPNSNPSNFPPNCSPPNCWTAGVGVTLDDVVVLNNNGYGVSLDGVSNDTSHANPINYAGYLGFINNACLIGPLQTPTSPSSWTTLPYYGPVNPASLRGGACPAAGYNTPALSHIPGWTW